jgi:hypothetical protein
MVNTARNPEKRNEELAAIALVLFAEHGFFGVSIKQIARKAGINPALIYYAAQRGRPFAGKRKSKVVERKKETKRA